MNLTKVLSEEKRPSPKQFNDSQNYHKNDYEDDDMQIEKVQINFFNDILEVILWYIDKNNASAIFNILSQE